MHARTHHARTWAQRAGIHSCNWKRVDAYMCNPHNPQRHISLILRDFMSSAILTAFVILLTSGIHAGVHQFTQAHKRVHGVQAYTAFPKLTLVGLAAALPALLHAAVRVFAWEHAYVHGLDLGPGLGTLLPACCLGAAVMAYLTWHSVLGAAYEPRPQELEEWAQEAAAAAAAAAVTTATAAANGSPRHTVSSSSSRATTDSDWGFMGRILGYLGAAPGSRGR
eukprot:scaffold37777_cov22-Tisochrysis_lutea.AAC.1